MSYLNTANIEVFPSTKRASKQPSARSISEKSIVSIINKMIDKEGFIITSESDYATNQPFEFNIKGYYFKARYAQDILDLFNGTYSRAIYANIVLKSVGTYTELYGQDDDTTTKYEGVQFSGSPITPGTGETVYSLLLFGRETTESAWVVAESSRIKFSITSVDRDVDGGEI